MKIMIIPAIVAVGTSTGAYRECPSELATARAAFAAYKDSYAICKVTASVSPDLSVTASEHMLGWLQDGDRFLSRTNYDLIPDHLDLLIAMMIDVHAAQFELDEFHDILEAETELPANMRSRFATSVEECERQNGAISRAEYLCNERVTPKAPRAPMSAMEEAAYIAGFVSFVLAIFVVNHM